MDGSPCYMIYDRHTIRYHRARKGRKRKNSILPSFYYHKQLYRVYLGEGGRAECGPCQAGEGGILIWRLMRLKWTEVADWLPRWPYVQASRFMEPDEEHI